MHDLWSPHETSLLSRSTQAGRDWPVMLTTRPEPSAHHTELWTFVKWVRFQSPKPFGY